MIRHQFIPRPSNTKPNKLYLFLSLQFLLHLEVLVSKVDLENLLQCEILLWLVTIW
jgi:hypothetical protein